MYCSLDCDDAGSADACACRMSETVVQLDDGLAGAHVAQPPASHGAAHLGSNVSRLKSRFLQHASDVAEPTSWRPRPPLEHQTSLPCGSSSSSAATGSDLLDMADHVAKFRHTRALFAQLAEQSSAVQPSPLPRPLRRSFRSTSSASPPPTRTSCVDQARRSVSPSNDRSSRSFGQYQGQSVSCNGVTTWLQLGSRSSEENSRSSVVSGSSVVSSRSQLGSRLSEEALRSQLGSRSSAESSRPEVTSGSLADSSRSASWRGGAVDPSEVTAVVLRRSNRPNLDLSVGAGRAVLLPKRRSREEKSLMVSKDCLEASLSHADEYWRRQEFSVGDVDPLMSESTFSSGSGEEMARSESGHDLAAALKDTTMSPTADSAEIWTRRLSAAMEAKVADCSRNSAAVECNGTSHTSSRTAENNGVVTSSRLSWTRGNHEDGAVGSSSDRETCYATDGSHCIAVQSDRNSAIDLSRSSDFSRSSVCHDPEVAVCSSSSVSELLRGNAADYSQRVTLRSDSSNLQTVASRTCDSSRSSPMHHDLDHTAEASVVVSDTVKGRAANSESQHVSLETESTRELPTANNLSRSLSARCDLERGSSTDCETLEGSVADCECKDVDTEKSLLHPDSAECCKTVVISTTLITSSHTADNGGDATRLQQQTEDSVVTGAVSQQPNVEDNLPCNGFHSGAHMQESGETDQICLEQQKEVATCCLVLSSSHVHETVVQELSVSDGLRETAEKVLQQEVITNSTELNTGAHSPEVYSLSSDNGLPTSICVQRTENSDTIFLEHQERVDSCDPESTSQAPQADTIWFRQHNRAGICAAEAGTQLQDRADVQAMSVSEDDESSGDTDYVVLGEPVSKHATRCSAEEVKHARQHDVP